jgi:hypothetical protein
VRQDAIDEVPGERAHPPAATGLAEPAAFARKGDDRSVPTAFTAHAQETVVEDATPQVRLELAPNEARPPARPVVSRRAREEGREVGGDGPVEDGLLGLAALRGRRGGARRRVSVAVVVLRWRL